MKVDDFLKFVSPDLPGCPDDLMAQAIMFVANRFCVDTQCIDVISDPVPLEVDKQDYDMDMMPGLQAITIKSVWTPTRELTPVTMSELNRMLPNWQVARNSEPSFYNMVKGFGTLTVYPIPAEPLGSNLTFHAVYAPQQFGTVVPDLLVDYYLDTIVAGAKARRMADVGKTWSNLQQAAIYQSLYDAGVVSAKIDVMHNRVPGSIRARPLRFGG